MALLARVLLSYCVQRTLAMADYTRKIGHFLLPHCAYLKPDYYSLPHTSTGRAHLRARLPARCVPL